MPYRRQKNSVSWLGVGAVAVVGGLGAATMYYSQTNAPPLPKFIEDYVEVGNSKLKTLMDEDKDEEPVRDKLLPEFPESLVQNGTKPPPTLVMCLDELCV
jgi:hypothetical protein